MVPNRKGLIVTTSSPGGLSYLFSTAYGINKVGQDRLASDMAMELREHNVASVCLWPGAVKTELFVDCGLVKRDALKELLETGESIDFSGKAVVALASDPKVMEKTGRILANMELAKEYGFSEDDGSQPHCPVTSRHLGFLQQLNDLRTTLQL
ncbi:CRE-DHS-9 protein [Aphelenchoides avenae]|nr:CRE-DHS-9 protein [Aphelenchus avenae]